MKYNLKNKNNFNFKKFKFKNFLISNDFIIYYLKNAFFIKKNYFFNKNIYVYKFFYYKIYKLFKSLTYMYCCFCYSKVFMKIGLGFRKKYSKKQNIFVINIGRRKWSVFKSFPTSFFFNIKRRNLYILANTKKKLHSILIHFKYMRKETVFKVKGIMTFIRIKFRRRVTKTVLFARRVKFKRMKLKLTKKQKQRK